MDPEESPFRSSLNPGWTLADETQLVEQLRRGDAEAGHQFVRYYYPGVYRYLLYLTGRREVAEDLTQETFLQAWRRLDTFVGRAPLRLWLHSIAHREFLQAVRRPRHQKSLQELPELSAAPGDDWTEALALRDSIRKLPIEEREIVILHYLHGYNCQEIAHIIRAPAGTVKYRLSTARARLQRELGDDDLLYLNPPLLPGACTAGGHPWTWLPLDQMRALDARLSRLAGGRTEIECGAETPRGTARPAAVATAAAGQREAQVVDSRLAVKVTLSAKGMALSDLLEQLRADTGINLTAGASVADEKVTVFCEKMPLREAMRQLSRPFGYTWLRTKQVFGVRSSVLGNAPADPKTQDPTPNTEYRYELVQDLRSQLLEEELRNRDRAAALVALDRELSRYRSSLDLSPDEALERARTAGPEEKALLETLAAYGWGPLQMYFRLSPPQLEALRAGQKLVFTDDSEPGELPLPADLARRVLQSQREMRIRIQDGRIRVGKESDLPDGLTPADTAEAHARVTLRIDRSELGQLTLDGGSGIGISTPQQSTGPTTSVGLATGLAPVARDQENRAARAADPSLQRRTSMRPQSSCRPDAVRHPVSESEEPGHAAVAGAEAKVTSADVLEAIHRASGLPIVADYYTHLFPLSQTVVQDCSLLQALNQVADVTRLRWNKDGNWLQFRSASFYEDRLKEVPNRLLSRWTASRQQHGGLTLDDLIEIAQLSDAQLDSKIVAEGIKECLRLVEWDLARGAEFRPHLRFLSQLRPEQRRAAVSPAGLAFRDMTLAQQQLYIAQLGAELRSIEQLAGAAVHLEYTQPGWFRWQGPAEPAPSPVHERTREAALQAARRIDPQADAAQIAPTDLSVTVLYTWGSARTGGGSRSMSVTPSYTRGRTDHFDAQ